MVKNSFAIPQFVSTMNCHVKRSIGKAPRDVKNTDFLYIQYNKPLTRYIKPKTKIRYSVKVSKNDIPFPQDTNHSLKMKVLKLRQNLQKNSSIHHQRFRKRSQYGKNFWKRAEKMFSLKVGHFLN